MGRKIPGRKHRGVRDLEVQKAIREEKLKTKINAPPLNPNEQEIPKSLQDIMRLKEKAKNFKPEKKRKGGKRFFDTSMLSKEKRYPGSKKPDKPIPSVRQKPGETDENFIKRVDESVNSVISELNFENRYSVHVRRNQLSGEIENIEAAEPDEFVEQIKNQKKLQKLKKQKSIARKKGQYGEETEPINSKQRRKMKLLAKKQLEKAEKNEQLLFRDTVKFGEVVHRPPELTARPRNAEIKKPGSKNTLLLQNILLGDQPKPGKNVNVSTPAKLKQEEMRNNVVQLYRLMKARKNAAAAHL